MDIEDSCKMRFQHTSVGGNHEFLIKNHNGVDPFNGSGWDQLIGDWGSSVVHQSEIFNSHYPVMYDHQTINVSSLMISKIPSFGGSQIVGDEPADSSASVKRKRNGSESHSPFNSMKSCEGNLQKVSSRNTSECFQEQEEKEKIKKQSKRSGKQVNTSKSDYVHMRAKRGQATNSHSLAERVRRERISERMRLLEDLVPGCNKITGKAMMLDEIINYVQSLQNQVEFLSMELATVNPELNLDMERLLSSKDVFHGRAASSAALALPPGLRTSQFSAGIPQGNFICGAPNMPQLYPLPQMVWDDEFQSDSSNGNRFSSTKWELKDWNNYNSI